MNRISRIAVNWVLFIIVSLAVLAVPLYMIARAEGILTKGNVYLFKVVPRDPYDPFRGRYLNISVEQNYVAGKDKDFRQGKLCYAVLNKDKYGYAFLSDLLDAPPANGDYIRVRYRWYDDKRNLINLPFGKYFVNEKIAPVAEKVVADFIKDPKKACVLKVRVKGGEALVEGLLLDGKPVEEVVKAKMQKSSE
ncbi:MAG: GDYXXLXY domain-containing protein [Lentisphaerae bacterium]|nr:GDYXXLXY domain-containing protein [Lentisphaerota bacterium]MCP4103379.1 GDYXXLXY domain-containing protein [Lentisphaerota bacterium]